MKLIPNNDFKAVYNPFNRKLAVKYGNYVKIHEFEESEEWVIVSFNGDDNHPNFLHIQLDYDESLELLFYPRVEGSEELNEDLGVYFNSNEMNDIPDEIIIVYNDIDFNKALNKL